MPPETEHSQDWMLEHARWRVGFRQSLLSTHRATPSSAPDWLKMEAGFEYWLQEALDALDNVKHIEKSGLVQDPLDRQGEYSQVPLPGGSDRT